MFRETWDYAKREPFDFAIGVAICIAAAFAPTLWCKCLVGVYQMMGCPK